MNKRLNRKAVCDLSQNYYIIMIVVDSTTIAIHRDLVDVFGNNFSRTTAPDGSLVKMVAKPDRIGINTIEVRPDIVRFDVSAKILSEQYKTGININTIGRVLDMINITGIIKLKSNNLSDYHVHKCDFMANFHTDKPHQNYYDALNIIHNPRYINAIYESTCKNGFAFIGKQSGRNKYMKFYSKEKELYRSCNKKFVEIVGISNLMSYFQNVIRIEFRAITHKQIRSYGNINNNDLESLLLSHGRPLYKMFCEILRGNSIQQDKLPLLGNIRTIKELESMLQYLGYNSWLNMFNNDIDNALSPIKQILKTTEKHKSNTSRTLKSYKDSFQKALNNDLIKIGTSNISDQINEIKEFLLNNV